MLYRILKATASIFRYCQEKGIKPHPARYPAELPEYFIRMLTDEGDIVVDPFAGSCVTGEVSERLSRRWICSELVEEYLAGALGRFQKSTSGAAVVKLSKEEDEANYYRIPRPGILWNERLDDPLQVDGGKARPTKEFKDENKENASALSQTKTSSLIDLIEQTKLF